MEGTKKQSIIRMAPCSSYEPERMASWLEFMAQRGYQLVKTWGCFAKFQKAAPQKLWYRLCELPEESLFNDRSPSDGEELIAICQAGGWQYLCKRGMFGIFVAADETVPELETERRPLYKRNIIFLLYILLASVLLWLWPVADYGDSLKRLAVGCILWLPLAFLTHVLSRDAIQIGMQAIFLSMLIPTLALTTFANGLTDTWNMVGSQEVIPVILLLLCTLYVICYFVAGALRNFLKRLHPKLPEYNQDWRNGALRYRVTTILCMVSYCFIFGFVFLIFLY